MLDNQVRQQFQEIVGEAFYKDDMESLVTHSYDGTPMLQSLPDGVIYPQRYCAGICDYEGTERASNSPDKQRFRYESYAEELYLCKAEIVMVMHRMNAILDSRFAEPNSHRAARDHYETIY